MPRGTIDLKKWPGFTMVNHPRGKTYVMFMSHLFCIFNLFLLNIYFLRCKSNTMCIGRGGIE